MFASGFAHGGDCDEHFNFYMQLILFQYEKQHSLPFSIKISPKNDFTPTCTFVMLPNYKMQLPKEKLFFICFSFLKEGRANITLIYIFTDTPLIIHSFKNKS